MHFGPGNRFVGGHLHTLGSRCWCGHLVVPVAFHERDKDGNVTKSGEEAYLSWLASDEKPAYVNPPVMSEIRTKGVFLGDGGRTPAKPVTKAVTEPDSVTKTCNACGKPVTGMKVCNRCRQAAYRERGSAGARG